MVRLFNLEADSEAFHLDAGSYRLTWRMYSTMGMVWLRRLIPKVGDEAQKYSGVYRTDYRHGATTRPLVLERGSYQFTLMNGARHVQVTLEKID